MLCSVIILALGYGAVAQEVTSPVVPVLTPPPATLPVTTTPPPPTPPANPPMATPTPGEIGLVPMSEPEGGSVAAGPDLVLAGTCPDDGVLTKVTDPKPQYYIDFGSFPKGLPGWTSYSQAGAQIPGVTITGTIDTQKYPENIVTVDSSDVCVEPALYQTELFSLGSDGMKMSFQVPDNVEYDITMHFAENYHLDGTPRVFDVSINNQPYLTQFNIASEVGVKTAVTKPFPKVLGQNGEILVTFVKVEDQPTINAIEVFPSGEYRTGSPKAAVERSVQLAAMFADFYSLLQSNELAEGVMGPVPI